MASNGRSFGSRVKRAWNAFMNRDPTATIVPTTPVYSYRPDRVRLRPGNEQSIINSIYNRIAIDVSEIDIKHVRLDDQGRYVETIKSGLNNCLSLEANIDQTASAFMRDVVMSMLDEGVVAIVPVDTDLNPNATDGYDVLTLRTGKILEWMPEHIRVRVYNKRTGNKEDIVLPKRMCAIIENPLYSVMNEPNSTLRRLSRKLALLDVIDENNSSAKLDLIIQLPYVIKQQSQKLRAEERRESIEKQLTGSKYGIAYVDSTEKITQLNRPVDNTLLTQVEYLTKMLYGQLGITDEVMNGTANEAAMLNYYNRTVEPIASAIADEIKRKFLTKTGRSQGQSIEYFRDPFKLVPLANLADIADKFTRNEILSSNEIRQIIGIKPSNDPRADQLVNSNNVSADQADQYSYDNGNYDNSDYGNGDYGYGDGVQDEYEQQT